MAIQKEYDLQQQWQLFCERGGLPENKMHPDQRREMKRAFFGACAQMLLLLRNQLAEYAEKEGDEAAEIVLQDMLVQCERFWNDEVRKQIDKTN